MQLKERMLNYLKSLDWRVLLAVPVLSVVLGVVCNLCVPGDRRVKWSGARSRGDSDENAMLEVKRGAWTSNFDVATNKAESAHVPVVVVVTMSGCGYCSRLHNALKGVSVKSWMKERGWYFVLVDRKNCEQAYELVRNTPSVNKSAPYVGVYWTRKDGTKAMSNFPGRHGKMGIEGNNRLSLEWMLAVEASVPGAPGLEGGVSAADIVRSAKVRIAAAADERDGAAGKVKIVPQVDFISDGQTVEIVAEPQKGSVFAGWRYPDGRFVNEKPRLTAGSHFQEGTYTAVFRVPERCAEPVLQLPEGEVTWEEGQPEELKLRVNEDAYPVSFVCRGLPPGMRLASRTVGVIQGYPRKSGVWEVEVEVNGASRGFQPAKGTFTVRVAPQERDGVNDDSENGEDVGNERKDDD